MDLLQRVILFGCAIVPAAALAEPRSAGTGLELSSGWIGGAAAAGVILLAAGVFGWLAVRRAKRRARLVVLTGPQAGEVIALGFGRHRIGSLPDNEIHLPSAGVSRRHAEIRVEKTRVQVRDLQSKNGTRVNGVPREVSPLLAGDRLEFGEVQAVFEQGPRSKQRKSSMR
jgi:hypothetical protein